MTTFGTYIKEKRIEAGLGLREMARMIEISPAYLSDIESDKRNPPEFEKLNMIVELLNLDEKQANIMYDLAGKKRHQSPPDITTYIMDNEKLRETLRLAKNKGMVNSDWEIVKNFVESL